MQHWCITWLMVPSPVSSSGRTASRRLEGGPPTPLPLPSPLASPLHPPRLPPPLPLTSLTNALPYSLVFMGTAHIAPHLDGGVLGGQGLLLPSSPLTSSLPSPGRLPLPSRSPPPQ